MAKSYAFFYDSLNDVEYVYRYVSHEALEEHFDKLNYDCAKYGVQDYDAVEIDEGQARDIINKGRDKTMYTTVLFGKDVDFWYVGENR